jgi:hypothetical protein
VQEEAQKIRTAQLAEAALKRDREKRLLINKMIQDAQQKNK